MATNTSGSVAGRLRILLVEDHDDSRDIMAKLLERQGHAVTTAADCRTARAAAQDAEFDALLLDIGLPDGTGIELLRSLTGHGAVGVALTGLGLEVDVDRCREAGFVDHLEKPVTWAKLSAALTVIRQRLDAQRESASNQPSSNAG